MLSLVDTISNSVSEIDDSGWFSLHVAISTNRIWLNCTVLLIFNFVSRTCNESNVIFAYKKSWVWISKNHTVNLYRLPSGLSVIKTSKVDWLFIYLYLNTISLYLLLIEVRFIVLYVLTFLRKSFKIVINTFLTKFYGH